MSCNALKQSSFSRVVSHEKDNDDLTHSSLVDASFFSMMDSQDPCKHTMSCC
jgi:hypothetical protein